MLHTQESPKTTVNGLCSHYRRWAGGGTWESLGEKSGASLSLYQADVRRTFTRGRNRLKICTRVSGGNQQPI